MGMEYDDEEMYYDEEMDENGMLVDMGGGKVMHIDPSGQQQLMYNDPKKGLIPASQVGMSYGVDSSSGDALMQEGFEILEEELDEDFEPNKDEIEEYAKYLGMDLKKDNELFYIAKEGLKAPLPGPWKPCKSPGGQIYYYNFESKELQKDHPCDDYYRKYYVNEKSLLIKKKEEAVIQKQIKS